MKRIIILVSILALGFACKSVDKEKETLSGLTNLSSQEILEIGDQLMAKNEFEDARLHYRFIYENFPNSPQSIKALIGLADSLYHEGGLQNMIQAFFRYEDFFNRFPQADEAEHALFMMGTTTFYQRLKPTLDTAKTREAMGYFTRYMDLFPNAEDTKQAMLLFKECSETLAMHEYEVAAFYYKRGSIESSLKRLEFLSKTYPQSKAFELSKELEVLVLAEKAKREAEHSEE